MAVTFLTDKDPMLRYDEQNLTDEQKTQVRENIGGWAFNNPNVRAVNHRGYCTKAPENTLSAYRLSRKMGFTFAECDVDMTSDGIPVLLHDGNVDRTSNGTGNIKEMTFEEARSLDFGSWFSPEYAGEKIPAFEEFIILCKWIGLHPYIEIKDGGGIETSADVKRLVDIVKRYNMENLVTWISFSNVLLGYVKEHHATARLGLVVGQVTPYIIELAKALKTDSNDVFIDANYNQLTTEIVKSCLAQSIPLEVWTVNGESIIRNLDPYVSGYTSDNLLANEVLYNAELPEYIPDIPQDGGNLLYRLPEPATLDGVDDYIDTGVKLFDEAKDFTIICDATLPTTAYKQVYNAFKNGNGAAGEDCGVSCTSRDIGGYWLTTPVSNGEVHNIATITASIARHAVVYKGGIVDAIYFVAEDGGSVQKYEIAYASGVTGVYKQHEYPLIIGCGVGWWQSKNNFADITVHNFEIWDYAMTAEQAAEKLAGL